jgi:hypothetical protein
MTGRGPHGRRARRAAFGATILAGALIAGGCGSSPEDARPQRAATGPAATTTTSPTTPARTPTTPAQTSTTPRPTAGGGTGTSTTTTTKPRSEEQAAPSPRASKTTTTPAAKPGRSTPAKLGKPQTFSGDGDRAIGNLVLKRNAVVRWTVSGGGAFKVRDAGDRLKISGRGTSGQTFAQAGDYRSVKVSASGRWTLSFATLGA